MLHGAGLNYNATEFRTGNGCFPPRRNTTYTFEKKISKRPQKNCENHKSNEMMLKPPKNDLAFNMLYSTIACSR